MSMLGEALVASAASTHTLRKAVKLGSFIAQPVRFTRLSARSLIASLFATSHPQSHSSVLKMSVAQFFPFKSG